MDNYFIVGLAITALMVWLVSYRYYSKRHMHFVQSFLDSNNSITVVCDKKTIISINKAGLKFFGVNNLKKFQSSHASISDLFIEEDGCVDKYTYGKNWIETIEKSKRKSIKVKLFSVEDQMYYYFYIKISKMDYNNDYILSFNNITDIEQEKTQIKKLAEYDPLTKIYNRVKLNSLFPEIFYKANRYGQHFSIILLDIDHFKKINDTYGHNIGDKVLVELARLINMGLRQSDTFARWGGEEFIIVSEMSTRKETVALASRLRSQVENYSFDIIKNITCSFGVSEFKDGDTQTRLLERVDTALYEAKERGRNQVVSK
ncbi:GGDEF domain-containing protein [bacterium]|nr:GGDEF domain-containing protein [bacterium]MBU1957742.1 GGDEF domain-containing protein [bacterium]